MDYSKNPTPGRLILFFVLLPFMAVYKVIMAVITPQDRQEHTGYRQPTGYQWKDKNGVWHTHYYVYDHPTS